MSRADREATGRSARSAQRCASKYWVSPAHPDVGLLRACLTKPDFPPHVHDALVIAVTDSGGAIVRGRGERFLADRRLALIFNPGEPHSSEDAGLSHWAYRAFYLRGAALDRLQQTLAGADRRYFTTNGIDDGELIAALFDWHRALEGEVDPFAIEERAALAMGLLYARHGAARPRSAPAAKDPAIVDRLVAQLQDRFGEPLHLVELAATVGLTQYQLISLFKAALGMTPYSLLTQIRLRRACAMMIDGMEICEAALAAGFYDQSALTRHFKRRFAVTPAQFVQARLG